MLDEYVGRCVERAVRKEASRRNVDRLERFLEIVSFSHGRQVNLSAMARECRVDRKVVTAYLRIAEDDLLLVFRLPAFRRRARRATVVHEKLYVFDVGVFRSMRPCGPFDRPDEIPRQALEGLVAQHLRAWAAYSRHDAEVFFWRTHNGTQVDFVVAGDAGVLAFKLKNTQTVSRRDLASLRAFRRDFPEAEAAVLYRGGERLHVDGVQCIPVDDFLRSVVPNRHLLHGT